MSCVYSDRMYQYRGKNGLEVILDREHCNTVLDAGEEINRIMRAKITNRCIDSFEM